MHWYVLDALVYVLPACMVSSAAAVGSLATSRWKPWNPVLKQKVTLVKYSTDLYIPVHTGSYLYRLVHTMTQYKRVHASTYMYILVHSTWQAYLPASWTAYWQANRLPWYGTTEYMSEYTTSWKGNFLVPTCPGVEDSKRNGHRMPVEQVWTMMIAVYARSIAVYGYFSENPTHLDK